MTPSDIVKLGKLARDAKSIACIGIPPKPLLQYRDKFGAVEECSLLVVCSKNEQEIIKVLSELKTACFIFVCDFEQIPNKQNIQNFLDTKCGSFQASRLMLVDGKREECLLARHDMSGLGNDRTDQISIFLVLKTGGVDYTSKYVNATANNIRSSVGYDSEIVCITDDASGINSVDRVVKMRHNWPKWWGKIELFREDITKNKHCLFMDLDTVCLKNIDFLCATAPGFYGIRDFYNLNTMQTGIMKWEVTDQSASIYHKFKNCDISKYISMGDHQWIGASVENPIFIQDKFPGEICSYKKHLAHIHKKFMDPSVVCFHGTPRPHTVRDAFITDVWKY